MASPLASIYSTADSFKRKLLDVLTDPAGSAQQIVGNANDRAGVLNALTGQLADQTMSSIKAGGSVMPDTPESQQLTQMMADAYNPIGLTVYHGSPYKFNAFAPKSIGSGEGAQAYGYGHYVAENPDVAKQFQQMLAHKAFDLQPEARMMGLDLPAGVRGEFIRQSRANKPPEAMARSLQNASIAARDFPQEKLAELFKKHSDSGGGAFYKIDLPDDQIAKMLDWDAEISKQTPEIQALAKQFGLASDDLGGDLVAAMNAKKPAGAEQMRQAGVPGIRYYDAQSRGGQKADTRNFVVFPQNEGLLNILERNGVPLK